MNQIETALVNKNHPSRPERVVSLFLCPFMIEPLKALEWLPGFSSGDETDELRAQSLICSI